MFRDNQYFKFHPPTLSPPLHRPVRCELPLSVVLHAITCAAVAIVDERVRHARNVILSRLRISVDTALEVVVTVRVRTPDAVWTMYSAIHATGPASRSIFGNCRRPPELEAGRPPPSLTSVHPVSKALRKAFLANPAFSSLPVYPWPRVLEKNAASVVKTSQSIPAPNARFSSR